MPDMPQDHLALDRASVRTIDPTSGHMHVSTTPISKANVCPYNGSEIPGADAIGLDPRKVYMLLRDPAELEKAAPTFEGKPLLIVHRPQSAKDHSHEVTVGAVHDVQWDAPYLKAALAVWPGDAIAVIESGDQRELSCGYAYDADMTPGTYDGVKYDGVMRNIRGNHVALVEEGRAGPDVMVGDSKHVSPEKGPPMQLNAKKLSRPALLAGTALRIHLQPKMAADAKFDLTPIVAKVKGGKAWKGEKARIKTALDAALQGKLATDADLEDVIELLDQLDDVTEEVAAAVESPAVETPAAEDDDADMMDRLREVLKAKGMSEEDVDAILAAMKPEVDPPAANDADKDKDKPVPGITKAAMDSAIAAATRIAADKARTDTIAQLRAIQTAEREVLPFVGPIAVAMDSAADVYKFALDHLKIDVTGLPAEGFGPLLRALPKPGESKPRVTPQAHDAAAASDRSKRFPNANRLLSV